MRIGAVTRVTRFGTRSDRPNALRALFVRMNKACQKVDWVFSLVLLGAFSPAPLYAQPVLDKTFVVDGSYRFGPEYVGKLVRIIAIGGGGGGSGAYSWDQNGRTGAGGGSGAIVFAEIKIHGSRQISWTIGKGGAGGPGWGFGAKTIVKPPQSGQNGGTTRVDVSFDSPILAAGGYGGFDIPPSGLNSKDGIKGPIPPQGGIGGIPWGISGDDGIPMHRFLDLSAIPGGKGGLISQAIAEGSGGDGGGVSASTRFEAGTPRADVGQDGRPGHDGMVRLQVGIPRPAFLNHPKQEVDKVAKDAAQHFAGVIDRFIAICQQTGGQCSNSFFKALTDIKSSANMPLQAKVRLLFKAGGGLDPFLTKLIKAKLPSPEKIIWYFVLNAKGDSRDVLPPLPALNPQFAQMSETELQELYGATIAAALWIETTFPLTEANEIAKQNLLDYSNAIKEEIIKRQVSSLPNNVTPRDFFHSPDQGGDNGQEDERSFRDGLRNVGGDSSPEDGSCMSCEPLRGGERCIVVAHC